MSRSRWLGHGRVYAAVLVALLLGSPLAEAAQGVQVRSETLLRFFERDTASTADAKVLPLYEYLQFDYGGNTAKGFTFHAYGWGRGDFGDGSYYKDDATGELLYGYLQYAQPFSNFQLRLGRQQLLSGLANDSLDGLSLTTDLGPYLSLHAFGGLPVAFDTVAGRSGDALYGGRLALHHGSRYELGLGYLQSSDDGNSEKQRASADLALGLPGDVRLDGRTVYNLDSDGFAEQSWQLRFNLGPLALRPYYEQYEYRDLFGDGVQTPNPFRLLAGSGEALTAWGADLAWTGLASWEPGLRVKQFSYDVNPETGAYYAASLTWHGAHRTQVGGEAGYLQGDAAHNDYLLGRLFVYLDAPAGLAGSFVSGDALYAGYDRAFFGVDHSWFASLGAGQRFLADALAVKLSADYSSDPNFDSDWRGTLALTYRYGQ